MSRDWFLIVSSSDFDFISSGDSLGMDPSQQKQTYTEVVGRRPDSILSLQHEVYGKRRVFSLLDS